MTASPAPRDVFDPDAVLSAVRRALPGYPDALLVHALRLLAARLDRGRSAAAGATVQEGAAGPPA
jgi:hypothetical protein